MTKAWKKPFLIFLLADILLFTSCTVYSSNCRDLAKLDSLDVKKPTELLCCLMGTIDK